VLGLPPLPPWPQRSGIDAGADTIPEATTIAAAIESGRDGAESPEAA
jgi:hypothetical protein